MSRSPPHPSLLPSVGSQDALTLRPPPPAPQSPLSPSWASLGGPPPWGFSCLLAVQHILVLASLLCVSHLLLLRSLPPGGLSSSPAQLLAASLFSSGVSTALQVWMGSRLPLVQAPSFEYLIPALVLTSQKLPMSIRTPGNSSLVLHQCEGPGCYGLELGNTSLREVSGAVVVSGLFQGTLGVLGGPGRLFPHCGPLVLAPGLVVAGLSAHREVALFCSAHWGLALLLILLMVVCSQHLGSCLLPPCPWRSASASPISAHIPAFRLLSVLIPVACVWIVSAVLGLSATPLELSAPTEAPWFWLPHPGEWDWPLLTPRALAAGISMALAASTSSLGCYALCGWLLRLPSPPSHACSRGLSLEGLGSVLAGLLGSPMGTASSFPNVGTVSLTQAGSRRVAHLVGLFCMGLGLSPRLTQLLTTIPLPVLGGVLGVTQAVVLPTGFSSFHLADIDSGRNVFIVGFSIFMALLLPRWLREARVLFLTGWSPLDVLLHSLLTEPVFLAGLLGFLLENTISGTQLERGLGQGLPSPFAVQKVWMPKMSRKKADQEYELPLLIQNLCSCIPQPLRCLCPLPEDLGNEERESSEPEEMADLLPDCGKPCPAFQAQLARQLVTFNSSVDPEAPPCWLWAPPPFQGPASGGGGRRVCLYSRPFDLHWRLLRGGWELLRPLTVGAIGPESRPGLGLAPGSKLLLKSCGLGRRRRSLLELTTRDRGSGGGLLEWAGPCVLRLRSLSPGCEAWFVRLE
ncbi:PREDICTED: solute carrier family 23 member 3 [Chrysochloris asiatica]|uniref:Solute carrier family 23 member 3 n=1 Tax=Chrysochloris asiatica TaxID=185453 RepID=A0A9B0WU17_CHRAS|nr:PREDICTED: solute carrier family 23 member 3 [Chrysochloris asiatica]